MPSLIQGMRSGVYDLQPEGLLPPLGVCARGTSVQKPCLPLCGKPTDPIGTSAILSKSTQNQRHSAGRIPCRTVPQQVDVCFHWFSTEGTLATGGAGGAGMRVQDSAPPQQAWPPTMRLLVPWRPP